ncbi:MAG: CYTH domain-containing protein [Rikenellaceae bacterium]|nr:CYTH domain-containing protein [Rikenellaceae bacterium]
MQEIERKYLVVGEYKHLAHSSIRMTQGYIASGRRTVRVRISDDRAWLTIKGPSRDGGLSRFEWEREIEPREALELMTLAEGALIDKRRHLIEYEGHTFEVDEFYGDNEGLVIAEVELSSEDEHVSLPDWIGREVTGVKRYYNSHLREHPYSAWSDEERI